MEIRKIKGLIRLLKASSLAEVEVTLGGCAIRVTRESSSSLQTWHKSTSEWRSGESPPQIEAGVSAVVAAASDSSADRKSGHVVRSSMVGTTYLSQNPEAPAFVAVGTTVKRGDTLGVVSTLSTSNRIEAGVSGTVTDVLVTNGQPVEFDQPMFVIG
ncbi:MULTISPECIES: acetyl-CoA carboxylase biotin carboxyl carrier protein [unclassified Lysobacter]|uniref:acetyl-CoA carboxylase biotin carboxyl carrier protein n=1 Tax=unclassified Lysobacter TaxID=2635362 RepID=UPI001BE6E617|nr:MULTISPECIES: acetyl-CoA carboxylase biotin carboxyl carrier protein [unclassified Lysobacter]MBT2744895.1 acetyl-CoA carboxylase biotin carboxyl carrier protein [Lysobacter sp. ISL-42]MBT2752112.1 acetyl-CoA carboxylase biotin carboxyl carrier protein [Lysobacter sp. ISL-50]MBT2778609.1 acetyl-CoA carboxylase biotin carboxyl carrier protein [Lysobacter sp. ISL-54]MBT2780460.1 acetyl-CoA carboxylase biotin carboxyl carrier protein [Lysobacter sp. ISL-52]